MDSRSREEMHSHSSRDLVRSRQGTIPSFSDNHECGVLYLLRLDYLELTACLVGLVLVWIVAF